MTIRKLEVNGWDLVVGADDVARVRDVELGARLGFARPAKFRELVKRLLRAGILNDSDLIPTVGRCSTGNGAMRDVLEYHLTERGALKAIVKSETAKAVEITGQVIDVYLAVRNATKDAPSALPLDIAHGPRIGETSLRAELASWCRTAALAHGCTIHRIHGALRREYRVPGVYALSLLVWPFAREFLQSLVTRKLALPGRPRLRLIQGGREQTAFPWGVA